MKLNILTTASLAFIALVECTPASVFSGASVSANVSVVASESMSASASASAVPDLLAEAQAIFPVPIMAPIPEDDENKADPISEVPIEQPIDQPLEHNTGRSQQNRLDMSEQVAAEIGKITASGYMVGPCDEAPGAACEQFLSTDGIICSHTSSGIHCSTRSGAFCSEDAVDYCYEFSDNLGLYCSNGGCSRYIPV